RRVVVNDDSGLTSQQLLQRFADMNITFPSLSPVHVEFHVRISSRNAAQMIDCAFRQNGSAEVCVQHYTRRIDERPQRGLQRLTQADCDLPGNSLREFDSRGAVSGFG